VVVGVPLSPRLAPVKLSNLLRALSVRVAVALCALLALQTLSATLSYMEVQDAAYTSSAINVAGYRRELTITAAFQARELMVGPDVIGTYMLAVDTMRDYTDKLQRYHSALLQGDAALRLKPTRGADPAQDALLFAAAPGAFDADAVGNETTDAGGQLTADVGLMGVDYLVTRYVLESNDFLARFEPYFGDPAAATTRYGRDPAAARAAAGIYVDEADYGTSPNVSVRHNLSVISADAGFARLQHVAFQLLDRRLAASVDIYLRHVAQVSSSSFLVQAIVYALNIGIVVLLQYAVFARQFAHLASEAQRTQELLRLVPQPVIDSVPRLRALQAGKAA
jgi:hypothetical protein